MNKSSYTISCGMYAFTENLQMAWRHLFQLFSTSDKLPFDSGIKVNFNTEPETFYSPDFVFGHTCGFPYIKTWRTTHQPFCVPVFLVPGCQGTYYSSWFVTHGNNQLSDLESFRNKTAVINGRDSNSGMNVLRFEISGLAGGRPFFGNVIESGSHLSSLTHILNGTADLCAMDAVTWELAKSEHCLDPSQFHIIGQSTSSPGLPFIMANDAAFDKDQILSELNLALEKLPEQLRNVLKISHFEKVSANDYDVIQQMEDQAVAKGYPELV